MINALKDTKFSKNFYAIAKIFYSRIQVDQQHLKNKLLF